MPLGSTNTLKNYNQIMAIFFSFFFSFPTFLQDIEVFKDIFLNKNIPKCIEEGG